MLSGDNETARQPVIMYYLIYCKSLPEKCSFLFLYFHFNYLNSTVFSIALIIFIGFYFYCFFFSSVKHFEWLHFIWIVNWIRLIRLTNTSSMCDESIVWKWKIYMSLISIDLKLLSSVDVTYLSYNRNCNLISCIRSWIVYSKCYSLHYIDHKRVYIL